MFYLYDFAAFWLNKRWSLTFYIAQRFSARDQHSLGDIKYCIALASALEDDKLHLEIARRNGRPLGG